MWNSTATHRGFSRPPERSIVRAGPPGGGRPNAPKGAAGSTNSRLHIPAGAKSRRRAHATIWASAGGWKAELPACVADRHRAAAAQLSPQWLTNSAFGKRSWLLTRRVAGRLVAACRRTEFTHRTRILEQAREAEGRCQFVGRDDGQVVLQGFADVFNCLADDDGSGADPLEGDRHALTVAWKGGPRARLRAGWLRSDAGRTEDRRGKVREHAAPMRSKVADRLAVNTRGSGEQRNRGRGSVSV